MLNSQSPKIVLIPTFEELPFDDWFMNKKDPKGSILLSSSGMVLDQEIAVEGLSCKDYLNEFFHSDDFLNQANVKKFFLFSQPSSSIGYHELFNQKNVVEFLEFLLMLRNNFDLSNTSIGETSLEAFEAEMQSFLQSINQVIIPKEKKSKIQEFQELLESLKTVIYPFKSSMNPGMNPIINTTPELLQQAQQGNLSILAEYFVGYLQFLNEKWVEIKDYFDHIIFSRRLWINFKIFQSDSVPKPNPFRSTTMNNPFARSPANTDIFSKKNVIPPEQQTKNLESSELTQNIEALTDILLRGNENETYDLLFNHNESIFTSPQIENLVFAMGQFIKRYNSKQKSNFPSSIDPKSSKIEIDVSNFQIGEDVLCFREKPSSDLFRICHKEDFSDEISSKVFVVSKQTVDKMRKIVQKKQEDFGKLKFFVCRIETINNPDFDGNPYQLSSECSVIEGSIPE